MVTGAFCFNRNELARCKRSEQVLNEASPTKFYSELRKYPIKRKAILGCDLSVSEEMLNKARRDFSVKT